LHLLKTMRVETSMDDVARAAGCSRSAVSLALRGHPSVPEVTRNRIKQVAERLGYRTNPLVSALMTLRRNRRIAANATIAILSAQPLSSPARKLAFYHDQMAGICARAAVLGFAVESFNLKAPGMSAARIGKILRTRNIRGVIVAPLPQGETTLDFDFSDLAVVALGLSMHAPVVERVANDHFNSAMRAVAECVALGYRRIGFINTHDSGRRLGHRWIAGYQFALKHHNLADQPEPLVPERIEHVARAIPAWLEREQPDVVIISHTEPEIRRQIPESIGRVLLGVDTASDPITGIYQNYPELGRFALEQLVQKLYINAFGLPAYAYDHLLEGIWVKGTTATGPKHNSNAKRRILR